MTVLVGIFTRVVVSGLIIASPGSIIFPLNLPNVCLTPTSPGFTIILEFKALKKLRTLSFYEDNILPNIFLPDLMALNSWDSKNNKIIYDKNIFNSETQTWNKIPSSQKSYKDFKRILGFSQDYDTGFVTISVKHQSPYIAQEWTNLIVNQLNDFFRTNDKRCLLYTSPSPRD